jgi:hypothetical protein
VSEEVSERAKYDVTQVLIGSFYMQFQNLLGVTKLTPLLERLLDRGRESTSVRQHLKNEEEGRGGRSNKKNRRGSSGNRGGANKKKFHVGAGGGGGRINRKNAPHKRKGKSNLGLL